MRPVNRGPQPSRVTARGTIQTVAPETYGFFMLALASRLGEYCSYCEVPLGANLAIEHVLPKRVFPNAETDWTNFLLACTNCNSTKGTRNGNRTSYYFPDTDDTFSMLEYYYDNNTNLCLVRHNTASTMDATRTQNIIDLVGLNAYNAQDTGKKSDRRVWNRTRTWVLANQMGDTLSGYYTNNYNAGNVANAANDPAIRLLKQQIRATAVAAGFWSVWMTVFRQKNFVTAPVRNQLLCDLFIRSFPGTRTTIAGTTCQ